MRNSSILLLAPLTFLLAAACGAPEEAEDEAPPGEQVAQQGIDAGSTAIVGEAEPGADSAAAIDDPFAGFALEAAPGASGDTSRIALLLRNDASSIAVVHADGGAGEVLLDSVPAGGSVRVDVVTPARTILLRSATPSGAELRRTEVQAGLDMVTEVIVGRAPPE